MVEEHGTVLDMFLIVLPWQDTIVPPCAPAVLKGIAESHGYQIQTHDFTLDLKNQFCNGDVTQFEQIQSYFISVTDQNYNQPLVSAYYDYIVDIIEQTPARFLGISVFSVWSHKSTFELCQRVKSKLPGIKIVLGGRGLGVKAHLSLFPHLTSTERLLTFDQILIKRRLADISIIGDAEDAIIDLLAGRDDQIQPVNIPSQNNLEYPFSSFDDYRLDQYMGISGSVQLPVISSKGCVRSCDFCDIGAHFDRFRSKQGSRLAQEIIHLSQRYNIYRFAFTDSIANGNMKSLLECCTLLAEHNLTQPDNQKIRWAANWICRPPNSIKPSVFDLLAASGCEHLTIGVEHGSDRVLEAMNKKTTVAGLYYELEQLHRVGIQAGLNQVIGHWSEQPDDFLEHIDMLMRLGPYYANRTVQNIALGAGFQVLKNTPAADNIEISGLITTDDNFSYLWYSTKNPNLTLKVRMARLYTMYRMALSLNIAIGFPQTRLLEVYNNLLDVVKSWEKFHTQHVDHTVISPCPTLSLIDNVDNYVDQRIKELFPCTTIVINLVAESYNGDPRLGIRYNGLLLYHRTLPPGHHELSFDVPYTYPAAGTRLEIFLDNKMQFDTQVDEQGNILQDKNIRFDKLVIDRVNLLGDGNFFYDHGKYFENAQQLDTPIPGLFGNSSIVFEFQEPFWRHYLANISGTLDYQLNSEKEKSLYYLEKIRTELDNFKF